MKTSRHLMVAAGLSALVLSSGMTVRAAEQPSQSTSPGFVPSTGQINPGTEPQASSQSSSVTDEPTPEEARAALMSPIPTQPSTGEQPSSTTGSGGSQLSPQNAGQAANGVQASAPSTSAGQSSEPAPWGPIGAVGQTIPAKLSKRNAILDRVPIMAWPLRLTDEQRKQIYDAVMAEKSQPASDADALKPASELSPDQALNGMHPLPESVRNIDPVSTLYYVKGKDKVLLVEPATRTVVSQITG
ncbi:MAG TPA: hypothetical protein VFP60_02445 [Pseudolabrys sp.]|nr:hypothetical protein [Pseudolabrys sp.]